MPATISNPAALNQLASSDVARRTSLAGSVVMLLPGTNDAPVRVAERARALGLLLYVPEPAPYVP